MAYSYVDDIKHESLVKFGLELVDPAPIKGGDIATSLLFHSEGRKVFCKYLQGETAYAICQAEVLGLEKIRNTQTINVPEIMGVGAVADGAFLLLDYIPPGSRTSSAMRALGQLLAQMHLITREYFGGDQENFIGPLVQSNKRSETWAEFYCKERLFPQYKMARDNGYLGAGDLPSEEHILKIISDLTNKPIPSLLHGDLWSGNYLIREDGTPYLIDPAVYFGHSEVDLAMTRLFGGFSESFYTGYHEIIPLETGVGERLQIYQLYYLLVHLNLFGKSYLSSVMHITKAYFL